MTFDEWVLEATADFPHPVQMRLTREYRSHYDEHLEAGGMDDPVALFGDAEEANLAWSRLYLDRWEYRSLQGPTRTLAFTFMLTLLTFPTRLAFPACWVAEGLAVLSLLVLWLLTRRLPRARQASLRLNVTMTLMGVMQGAALIWPKDTALIFQLTAGV